MTNSKGALLSMTVSLFLVVTLVLLVWLHFFFKLKINEVSVGASTGRTFFVRNSISTVMNGHLK